MHIQVTPSGRQGLVPMRVGSARLAHMRYMKTYYQKNGVRMRRMSQEWRLQNSDRVAMLNYISGEEAHRALVYYYGPYRCADCGETNPLALTWAHSGGTGAAHRKEMNGFNGGGQSPVRLVCSLKSKGWPNGFLKVQCGSCQWIEERKRRMGLL
jgi:hypothetical protein